MEIIDITQKAKPSEHKNRFAAYCRVSSNSEDQMNSFSAQVRRYKHYESTHPGYELVDIYADEGLTGTEMENRAELQRLICDCEKGKIDTIIVKSVSRMARNTEDLLELVRKFKMLQVNVHFEEEKIDTNSMNSEMLLTIKGMSAQQESVSISQNVRWTYQQKIKKGEPTSTRVPYGYKYTKEKLVIVEDEAKVVRRIFDLYLSGVGILQIAKILTDEKVPKRDGTCRWSYPTVRGILHNEKYMGDSILQKYFTTDTLPFKSKVNNGERAKTYVENSHEAIISKEQYEKAQSYSLQKRNACGDSETFDSPFRRIMACDFCGRRYVPKKCNGKHVWGCNSSNNGTISSTRCPNHRIKDEAIYETYQKMMYKLSCNKNLISDMVKQLTDVQRKVGGGRERIRQIDTEIANLAEQKNRIALFNAKKVIKDSEYASMRQDLDAKISDLRSERLKITTADRNEEYIDEINELLICLEDFSMDDGFDEDLFMTVVKGITVVSLSELRFRLIGEIEVSEEIPEWMRCKRND